MVAGAGTSVPALAAPRPNPDAVTIAVQPIRILVRGSAKPVTRTFRVWNGGQHSFTAVSVIQVFRQLSNGGITFANPLPDSGAQWMTVTPARFLLRSHETKTVRVTVRVPANHSPGERYLGVIFRAESGLKASSTGAITTPGIGVQLIIDVSGKVRRGVKVGPLTAPWFTTGGPIPLSLTYRNTGNVYSLDNNLTAASGTSRVRFPGILVLAGSERVVQTTWASPPLFCLPCRISADGASVSVWRVDVPYLVLALVCGLALATIAEVRRRFRRAVRGTSAAREPRSARHAGAGHARIIPPEGRPGP
jgi:hypothetical protein